MRSFLAWLVALLFSIFRRVSTFGDAWTIEPGKRYRMRIWATFPRPNLESARSQIRATLERAGFAAVVVYVSPSELPATWTSAGVGTARAPAWEAWAEATFSRDMRETRSSDFDSFRVVRSDVTTTPPPAPAETPAAPPKAEAPTVDRTAQRTRPEVHLTSDLSWDFFEGLWAIGKRHGWRPIGILMVMQSESQLHAGALHRTETGEAGAAGLIQIEPEILRDLGWGGGPEEFAALSASAQLPYVERYYATRPHMPADPDPVAFYVANFTPAFLSKANDPDALIAREDDPELGWIVRDNPVFAEGTEPHRAIYVRGLARRLATVATGARWLEAVRRLQWVEDEHGGDSGWSSTAAIAVAVVGIGIGLGVAAAHFVRA